MATVSTQCCQASILVLGKSGCTFSDILVSVACKQLREYMSSPVEVLHKSAQVGCM